MAKKSYFINLKFSFFLDSDGWSQEKLSSVKDCIQDLPSCEFEFESESGNWLRIDGGKQSAEGTIAATLVDKLIHVEFQGWFKIDCAKRRDKAETWLEPAVKSGLNLFYKSISVRTPADTYVFMPLDSKGEELDKIQLNATLVAKKPDGVNF